jgi:UDPglucose 6-dehydrogenase
MTNYFCINIIGYGYVGGALGFLCGKNKIKYNVCDTVKKNDEYEYYTDNIKSLVENSEKQENNVNVYFIAVPTPSDMNGNCDTSIIDNVLNQLSDCITKKSIIIIKSTMVPGSCDKFADSYPNLNIVLCPEFLRESTYKMDMYNAEFVLLGLRNNNLREDLVFLFRLMYSNNPYIDFYFKTYKECEIFKYTLNVHLAVKVIIMLKICSS